MRVYRCDRCKQDIKIIYLSDLSIEKTKYKIEGHLWWKKIKEDSEDIEFQLCPECSKEFEKWLGAK